MCEELVIKVDIKLSQRQTLPQQILQWRRTNSTVNVDLIIGDKKKGVLSSLFKKMHSRILYNFKIYFNGSNKRPKNILLENKKKFHEIMENYGAKK